jgi:hypothetical protein
LSQFALAVTVAVALTGASVEPWSWSSADHGIPKHLYFTLRLAQILAFVPSGSNWKAWAVALQVGTVAAVLALPSTSSAAEPHDLIDEEQCKLECAGLLTEEEDVACLEEAHSVEQDENSYTESEGPCGLASKDRATEPERVFATDLSNRLPQEEISASDFSRAHWVPMLT